MCARGKAHWKNIKMCNNQSLEIRHIKSLILVVYKDIEYKNVEKKVDYIQISIKEEANEIPTKYSREALHSVLERNM